MFLSLCMLDYAPKLYANYEGPNKKFGETAPTGVGVGPWCLGFQGLKGLRVEGV